MAIVKHNARTFRRDHHCRTCGVQFFYWGHDTESMGHGRKLCPEHTSYSWVPLDRDGNLHLCPGHSAPTEHDGDNAATGDDPAEVTPPPGVGTANGHAVADEPSEALNALKTLMRTLGPESTPVDESQVRAIVRAEIQDVTMPLRVEVSDRATGQTRQVSGAANAALPEIIKGTAAGLNIMMVGPMGTGKSFMAKQVGEALNVPVREISLTPQTSESKLFGYMDATGRYVRTAFRDWWEFGGLFHFDEFDNGHPSIMAGINAAMAQLEDSNAALEFPDGRIPKAAATYGLASANTYGRGPDRQYQRQQLDAATTDRFEMVYVDYDKDLERQVCLSTGLSPGRVDQVLAYVRYLRGKAEEYKMPLGFGLRRSRGVCKWLAAGVPARRAIEMSVRRGISDPDWRKVSDGAPVLS